MPDENTIRETLSALRQEMRDNNRRLEAIERTLENRVTPKDDHAATNERVAALEDTFKWLVRTIVGTILLGGLTMLGFGKKFGVL